MAADGSVVILIEGDDSDLEKKLNNIGSIAGTAAKTAAAAIAAVGTACAAAATHAAKVGAEFEASMSNVAAISGATGEELEALTEKAKEMGSKTKFSATESADALSYMAMAGWKTEDMLSGIEGIMNLAAASGENLSTTADIVTDALTAFGLSAADSGHFADVLAAASSNANTNVAMLGESFKYAAPLAGAMNYSVEDMAVALGLMANSGIKASQAGTTFRSAINAMVKPSDKAAEAMADLGLYADGTVLALENSDGSAKSLSETMGVLREAFSGLSETEQTFYAAQIFGTEAMSGMLAIINSSEEDYSKLTDAISGATGAAEEMAEIQLDNLSGQIEILKSAIEGFEVEFYQSVSNPITDGVRSASEAVSQLTKTFKDQGLGAAIQELGGMAAAALASIAAQAPAFIDTAANLIQSFLAGIQNNLPQLASSALSIVSSLAQGVVAVLPQLAATGAQMIAQLAQSIIDSLPGMIPAAVQTIAALVENITGNLSQIIDSGIQIIVALGEGLIEAIPDLIENVPEIVSNIANVINDNAPKMLAAAATLIVELGVGLIKSIPTLVANIPQIIAAIVDAWSAFNWLNLGKSAIEAVKNGVTSMLNAVKTAGKGVLDAIVNAIKNLPTTLANIGRNGVSGLANAVRNLAGTARSAMQSVVTGSVNTISGLPNKMLEIGKNIVQGIARGISNGASAAINAVADLASRVLEKAKSALGIASPSRVMRDEVGAMLPPGVGKGVEKAMPALERSVQADMDALSAKMRDAVQAEVLTVSMQLSGGAAPEKPRRETVGSKTEINISVTVAGGADESEARNVGREIGRETVREMRRRGLVLA